MSQSELRHYPSIFSFIYLAFLLPSVCTLPFFANETLYQQAIDFLQANNCKMPKEINLPFQHASDPTDFSYLSIPLKKCQIYDSLDEDEEAHTLCKEIFEVLKNITCSGYDTTIPKIKSSKVASKEVCSEFKDMKDVLPKQNQYLSGKLVDGLLCKILCSKDYTLLCTTLLWCYDIQAQIEGAINSMTLAKNIVDNDKLNEGAINSMTLAKNIVDNDKLNEGSVHTDINVDNIQQEPLLDNVSNPKDNEEEPASNLNNDKTVKNIIGDNSVSIPSTSKYPISPTSSTNLVDEILSNQTSADMNKITNPITSDQALDLKGKNIAVDKQNKQPEASNIGLQDNEPLAVNQKIDTNSANLKENDMNAEKNPKEFKHVDPSNTNDQKSNLAPKIVGENKKESTSTTLELQKNKSTTNVINNVKSSTTLENPIPSNIPKEDNLSNVQIQVEENESKIDVKSSDTLTSIVSDKNNIAEKPKESDSVPNKVIIPDSESTTLQIYAGNSVDEEPEDKDPEYFNDNENNEGDYTKSDYENTVNEIVKLKKAKTKPAVVNEGVSANDFPGNYEGIMNTRNNIDHVSDEIQIIPSFPEQEDGHFFFYFLSIVLILMAGYLIFHNKQKIIALIVEGRHERRRRSHGAGYKKLETK